MQVTAAADLSGGGRWAVEAGERGARGGAVDGEAGDNWAPEPAFGESRDGDGNRGAATSGVWTDGGVAGGLWAARDGVGAEAGRRDLAAGDGVGEKWSATAGRLQVVAVRGSSPASASE